MTSRKSPIRHRVRTHKRRGKVVSSFERGSGTKKSRVPRSKQVTPRFEQYKAAEETKARMVKLPTSGFCDELMAEAVYKINNAGIETVASCSGAPSDHPGDIYHRNFGYLDVVLPESVVDPKRAYYGGDIFEVPDSAVLNRQYVKTLQEAGRRAGFRADLSKYLMSVPVIDFRFPRAGTLSKDALIDTNPKYEEIQKELNRSMGGDSKKFLATLDKRDELYKELYAKYGGHMYSDKEAMVMWDKLANELVKIAPKLKRLAQ